MTQFVSNARIREWCELHPTDDPVLIAAHQRVRAEFQQLMLSMNGLLPEGSDKSALLRKLHGVRQEANTILAIEQRLFPLAYDPQPAADA
jgi:hypothetical protein